MEEEMSKLCEVFIGGGEGGQYGKTGKKGR